MASEGKISVRSSGPASPRGIIVLEGLLLPMFSVVYCGIVVK